MAVEATKKLLALDDAQPSKIQIVGLASFDGALAFNEKIAQGRADALKKYIRTVLPSATTSLRYPMAVRTGQTSVTRSRRR